jgi:epoxide hydrolase-like predicted phosphatase
VNIRAVIWDLGEVILRTENSLPRQLLAREYGKETAELEKMIFNPSEDQKACTGEISEDEFWKISLASLNLSEETLRDFPRRFWGGDCVDQKVLDFISGLRPRYRTGLLSNAWSNVRVQISEYFDYLPLFDEIIFSYEVGLAKPDPRIYRLMLEKLGVQATEAIFIDDNLKNVKSAAELGIHVVHFIKTEQALAEISAQLGKDR